MIYFMATICDVRAQEPFANCFSTLQNSGDTISRKEYVDYVLRESCKVAYSLNETDREIKCMELEDDLVQWRFIDLPENSREEYCTTACWVWGEAYVPVFEDIEYDFCVDPEDNDGFICDGLNDEQTEYLWLRDLNNNQLEEALDDLCSEIESFDDVVPLIHEYYGLENLQPVPSFAPNTAFSMAPSFVSSVTPNFELSLAPSTCDDVLSWTDSDGNTCQVYADSQWCSGMQNDIPDSDLQGSYNLTAVDACCVCGGGNIGFPAKFDFLFSVHISEEASSANNAIALHSGSLNIMIVDEMTRILIESHSDVKSIDQVDISTVSVDPCDEGASDGCYIIEMKVTVYNTYVESAELISSLRDGQVDKYYYSDVSGLAAAPSEQSQQPAAISSSDANSSDGTDSWIIGISLACCVIVLAVLFVRWRSRSGKVTTREKDFSYEDYIDKELQSPPKEAFPRPYVQTVVHESFERNQDTTDVGIPKNISFSPMRNVERCIPVRQNVSFGAPVYIGDEEEDEEENLSNEEKAVKIPEITVQYEQTNTSMEANIETNTGGLQNEPAIISNEYQSNLHHPDSNWGVAPSTSSSSEEQVLNNNPSLTDQAIDALGLDALCINIQKSINEAQKSLVESLPDNIQPSGAGPGLISGDSTSAESTGISFDDGSTWATEDSYRRNHYLLSQQPGNFGTTLETVEENELSSDVENTKSRNEVVGSSNTVPLTVISSSFTRPNEDMRKPASPDKFDRVRTEVTTATTATTNTQQASNTQKAVQRRNVIDNANKSFSKIEEDEENESGPKLLISGNGTTTSSEKKWTSDGNNISKDDSSLGSLGDLSSMDSSAAAASSNNFQSTIEDANPTIPAKLRKNEDLSLKNEDKIAVNPEFNDWLQNEIDSLKVKGNWGEIEELIENTPNESTSHQQKSRVLSKSSNVNDQLISDDESMPDDEMMSRQNSSVVLSNTAIRKMYT